MKFSAFFVIIVIVLALAGIRDTSAQTKPVPDQTKTEQDTTKKKNSMNILLQQMEIRGWVEKPQMVYVVPGTNPKVDDIILERSFIDEILRPLDKDKFEKQHIFLLKKNVIPW